MSASPALAEVSAPVSLYYTDEHNDKLQAQPVTYDTRFKQGFQTLGAGVQVIQIPVDGGLSKCMLVIGMSATSLASLGAGDVIPKAWGYSAIQSITWRVAGSSEYSLSGAQLLAKNMRLLSDAYTRNQVYNLGGNQILGSALSAYDQYAYIPLPLWSMPDNAGFNPVIAGDLLAQQVQIRVTMNAPNSLIKTAAPATAGSVAGNLYSVGYFQAEFLRMKDRHQSLANEKDFDSKTYVAPLPCDFDQTELIQTLPANSGANTPLTFSGFQFGEVKAVQVFLTSDDASDVANGNVFFAPKAVTLQYAGTNYAQYDDFSSRLWNIMDGTAQSAVNCNILTQTAPSTWTASSGLCEWVMLPLAQPMANDHATEIQSHGMVISNGSITLIVTPPDTKQYKVHCVPILRGALSYSRGSGNILIG